ncbi:MAG: transglutaminase domain-containing protein [Spirochaetes bacterium]|nr:transglutaminase domain-containing protein [Spirochaetota bacterium]
MDTKNALTPTYFIDSDNPAIIEQAGAIVVPGDSALDRAVKIYYWVRDRIPYNPYRTTFDRGNYRASFILRQGDGFCVQKAVLAAALSRAAGVPSRLRFATVRNHLITKRLREAMKTDLFVYHGLVEFFLEGRWVKATPAFNLSLCEKFGILPLEFNGREDSILHPFDREGNRHMEYLHDFGAFDDLPFERMMEEYRRCYPHLEELLNAMKRMETPPADFEREAEAENRG